MVTTQSVTDAYKLFQFSKLILISEIHFEYFDCIKLMFVYSLSIGYRHFYRHGSAVEEICRTISH